MCVGIKGKVIDFDKDMAIIDATGAKRKISRELIDELDVGDYVMVHAGIAIAKITNEED